MIKVKRTNTPPASLSIEKAKRSGRYCLSDVVDLLEGDFKEKCYLCEIKPVYDINIEHLVPHKGNKDLMFDWNNLFYSCPHCNSVKNNSKYDGKILDCCQNDPEKVLYHIFENGHVLVKPVDDECTDEVVLLTADLITKCFESDNPAIRTKGCDKRVKELKIIMMALYDKLNEYRENPHGTAINAIRGMLDLSYKFAGFTRTYVRLHLSDYPDLKQYVA